jgi:hypothetical protein
VSDKPCLSGRVSTRKVEGFIKGTSPTFALGVMIIVTAECCCAKKGVYLAGLVSIERFTEGGRRLIRQQVAIIDEGFEYASGISEEGVT